MDSDEERASHVALIDQLMAAMTSPPNLVVVIFLTQLFFLEPQHPSGRLFAAALKNWTANSPDAAVNSALLKVSALFSAFFFFLR